MTWDEMRAITDAARRAWAYGGPSMPNDERAKAKFVAMARSVMPAMLDALEAAETVAKLSDATWEDRQDALAALDAALARVRQLGEGHE